MNTLSLILHQNQTKTSGVLTPFRVYVDDLAQSGVHTRNWPIIDFQPVEFNFEFYFWRFGAAFR